MIKHLTHKVEDLSSEPQPQNPQGTPILATYACNTSKCKMGDRSSKLVNLICFDTKPLSVFVSKNREGKVPETTLEMFSHLCTPSVSSTHIYVHTHVYTHAHTHKKLNNLTTRNLNTDKTETW